MSTDVNVLGVTIVATPTVAGPVGVLAYTGAGMALLVTAMVGLTLVVLGLAMVRITALRRVAAAGPLPSAAGSPPGGPPTGPGS